MRIILLFLVTCWPIIASATEKTVDIKDYHKWAVGISIEAEKEGISDQTLYNFLNNIKYIPRVIELDNKQPYKTKTFEQYLQHVTPQSRITKARKKYNDNKALLDKISKSYGVQSRFIVALWAVESDFGRNMGGFNILNSLATLAYDGRRASFFKEELLNALKIIDQGHIAHDKMIGSWAGAMGQTQFMPSSFLELAVDQDGDGKRDIWHTRADAFGSIANYLSRRGWDEDTTWGRAVKVPSNFNRELISSKKTKTIQQWHDLGVRKSNGNSLPLSRGNLKASLVQPDDDDPAHVFLVYDNYKTILKWNRSLYFATAVGLLSDKISN
tara:strand:- start:773 stop:1753 length:981 start_codon:yes stop_codon:yes gene_type:complete